MRVSPDALPVLQPTVDLRVILPEAPPKDVALCAREKRKAVPVEAGLLCERADAPPAQAICCRIPPLAEILRFTYPDVPDNQSFRMYLHWPNISLSATFAGLLPSIAHTPYVPPHPAWGMPSSCFATTDPTAKVSLPPAHSSEMVSTYEGLCRNMHLGLMAGVRLCRGRTWIWRVVISEVIHLIVKVFAS